MYFSICVYFLNTKLKSPFAKTSLHVRQNLQTAPNRKATTTSSLNGQNLKTLKTVVPIGQRLESRFRVKGNQDTFCFLKRLQAFLGQLKLELLIVKHPGK